MGNPTQMAKLVREPEIAASPEVPLSAFTDDVIDMHMYMQTITVALRRLLATDLVNNGLPIHIGAALLGHLNIQTTQGYVAVFEEDVIRHVQDFLTRRRGMRPGEEYRPATEKEWQEFEEHSDKRKVELGSCGRPYGTSCQHEHACLRCAQLHVNPKMLPRLDELESDLEERKTRAASEGWLGEIEGIDRTLQCLRDKRADALRLTRITRQVDLGMPPLAQPDSRASRIAPGT